MTPAAKPDYAAKLNHGAVLKRLLSGKGLTYLSTIEYLAVKWVVREIEQYERQREELRALCDEARAARDIKIRADVSLIRPEEVERIMQFDTPAKGGAMMASPFEIEYAPQILAARVKAAEQWGGPDHDATHTYHDWGMILAKHVGKCLDADRESFHKQMIKIIAIALDALDAMQFDTPAKGER